MSKLGFTAIILSLCLNSATFAEEAPPVKPAATTVMAVHEPWVREAPPNAEMLAAYMHLENATDREMVLVGASSPEFAKVEIHNSVIENGIAKMIPQPELVIAAKKDVMLAPGGLHIMLINPKQPLKAGDKVNLTLNFKDGTTQAVQAEVKRNTDAPAAESHQHH